MNGITTSFQDRFFEPRVDLFQHQGEEVCSIANISHKTPHAARHAMGRHIIDKTGNIAAVQQQLGHRNVAYSVQLCEGP